jgi:hypothetical protein
LAQPLALAGIADRETKSARAQDNMIFISRS